MDESRSPSPRSPTGSRDWMVRRMRVLEQDAVLRGIVESGIIPGNAREPVEPRVDVNEQFGDGSKRRLIHLLFQYTKTKAKLFNYVTILIDFNVDLNVQDCNGVTPAMAACLSSKTSADLLRFMVNQPRVALETQDALGRTVLMYAVHTGIEELARVVADAIMKRNQFSIFVLRNNKNESAEDIARRLDYRKCERILSKRRLKMLEQIHKQLRENVLPLRKHRWLLNRLPAKRHTAGPAHILHQVTCAKRALNRWEGLIERKPLFNRDSLSSFDLTQLFLDDNAALASPPTFMGGSSIDRQPLDKKRSNSYSAGDRCSEQGNFRLMGNTDIIRKSLLVVVHLATGAIGDKDSDNKAPSSISRSPSPLPLMSPSPNPSPCDIHPNPFTWPVSRSPSPNPISHRNILRSPSPNPRSPSPNPRSPSPNPRTPSPYPLSPGSSPASSSNKLL